ncbi:MAG: carcinine hydrolase/isopenicillin-N N-acyltransferase family protein [Synergistaceae bacterium]|nr:carcinine hydrolase/isopenicillin-N N-acyltransferase family protein [Synergistaceae bacterium]
MIQTVIFISALICAVIFSSARADACTLFAAAGDDFVMGGGTLIAKTRDRWPQYNGARLYAPKDGYSYYAIVAGRESGNMTPRGGINEKGLAVVTASASAASMALLCKLPLIGNISANLLSHCANVEEAIEHIHGYRGQFVMLADKRETALVVISPDGTPHVTRAKRSHLYRTNHYAEPELECFNVKPAVSSHVRYERIRTLLNETPNPFSIDDFIRFADDRHDGPDNSIWRTGGESRVITQAALVVHIPPNGSPDIYVKYIKDPAQKEKFETLRLNAQDIFNASTRTYDV